MWSTNMGNCEKLYGTFQDIDQKKKADLKIDASKKLLDDVLNAASEVSIIATDKNGLITVFNTGAERMLGYSAERIIGKHSLGMIYAADEVAKRGEELTEEYGYSIEGFQVFVQKAEKEGYRAAGMDLHNPERYKNHRFVGGYTHPRS